MKNHHKEITFAIVPVIVLATPGFAMKPDSPSNSGHGVSGQKQSYDLDQSVAISPNKSFFSVNIVNPG